MTIQAGDKIGVATGGVFEIRSASSLPSTPTISVVTGDSSVTVTIDGDSGVTNYLLYKAPSDTSWQDGGSRSGDGDLVVSSLSDDVAYVFVAYSKDANGTPSLPSMAVAVTLSEDSTNDADDALVDSAQAQISTFGESIAYLPGGGGERTITAIVDRKASEGLDDVPNGAAPFVVISVMNSSTTGISSSEVNTGTDKARVSFRKGETARARRIVKPIGHNAGMLQLKVQ